MKIAVYSAVLAVSLALGTSAWAGACSPDASASTAKACRLITKAQECKSFFTDSRYETGLMDRALYALVLGLPAPSKATAKDVKSANAMYGMLNTLIDQCVGKFQKKGQQPQEKTFGEKAADTRIGQAIEKAGDKMKSAAKELEKVIMAKIESIKLWVKDNAKKYLKMALKKGIETARSKGEGYLTKAVQNVIKQAVQEAADAVLPLYRQAKLGLDICTMPFIASAVSAACSASLNWLGALCIPGCPTAAAGLVNWMKGQFVSWASGKIYGTFVQPIIQLPTNSLVGKLNARIDAW
jgi:hypothetical protein